MPIAKVEGSRNGLQKYRVRVNYTDVNGEYRQMERVAYGKAEAMLVERQMTADVSDAANTHRMTVQELFDEYMQDKKANTRETTYEKVRRIVEAEILPKLGDVRIDRLGVKQLQEWKNRISERDLKTTTKNNHYRELSAMLNYAEKRGYIAKNPLRQLGRFRDAYQQATSEKIHYYTAEEFLRYISVAHNEAKEKPSIIAWGLYVFFNVAFYTGMRKGEINALKWSDIEGNIIHVRRSIAQKLKGADRETPPKNASSNRDLQMPAPLAEVLAEHKERQRGIDGFSEDFRVCGAVACLRDTTIDHANKHFSAVAGLPHIRIHDFRHSHATLLANEGINIQEIARRLGHADVQMTWNTYSHLYPREEERAVAILNRVKK